MPAREKFLSRTEIELSGSTVILVLWDAYDRYHSGQQKLGYQLVDTKTGILFKGEDYGCSPLHAIDSEDAARGILSFLSLKPGDTDAEYFAGYTQKQLDFVSAHGEELSLYACDEDWEVFTWFDDLTGW